MPFTLSHAAAALPFRKLKPVWPALVIGTFAPDLQYYIWISDEDRSGHHFPQVLFLTLPLALLALWMFERIIKAPVIELLPSGLQCRLRDKTERLSFRGWQRFSAIVLWTAVGIGTHIFWDQFTHSHTWVSAHWSLLRQTIPLPFHVPVRLLGILQHASTLLGLVTLAAWLGAWYRKTKPVPEAAFKQMSPFRKGLVVFTMAAIALLGGYPLAIVRLADHHPPINPFFFIATVTEATTLVLCMEVLIYGLTRMRGANSVGAVSPPRSKLLPKKFQSELNLASGGGGDCDHSGPA
jgi:hypothetical protein